ncbi:MAG TPA: signal peptidase I [Trebonia sp.]|nr:signal peptidase I [Trebonia sp.]
MNVEPGQPDGAGTRSPQSADSNSDPFAETASIDLDGQGGSKDTTAETVSIGLSGLGSVGAAGGAGRGRSGADGTGADSDQEADAAEGGDEPSDTGAGDSRPARPKRKRSLFREVLVVIVAALVLTIVIKSFLVQVFVIPSGSMENTLQIGDRILVNRLVYHIRPIARGDIVVFSGDDSWGPEPPPPPGNPVERVWDDFTNVVGVSAPGTDYVKRVIGLPGDHVMCCTAQGQLTVNGVALNESSYLYPGDESGSGDQQPYNIVVPPGRLFVLGDHRSDSADSRYHTEDGYDGTIPENEVVGRAFVIIWPPSRIGDLPIPATFQQAALKASTAAINYGPAAGGATAAAGVLVWRRRRSSDRAA